MKPKLLILSLSIALSINAQRFDKARMDSLFSIMQSNDQGMGSISVFSDGREVYQKSYGLLDVESQTKANAETKYRIGSITKTYTATIIMKLIEDGQLSLQTKLDVFYPQIKNADKITIEYLLRHKSGIFNFTNSADYLIWNTNKLSKEALLKKIVAYESVFEPNSKFEYSNSNYVLLTLIAEDVSGKTYANLLEQYITSPCSLTNTVVGSKIEVAKNEANSYKKFENWILESETDMSVPLGAGSIMATPSDINTFFVSLFEGKIVTQESLKLMQTIDNGMGLGMFQVPFYEMRGYGHTGGIDGFNSTAFYFPNQKVSAAITSNATQYPLNDILIGVLSIYFGKKYQLPRFAKAVALKSEDLDKYLGVYSSPTFPLKVTITKNNNILVAQATGQPSLPLECFEIDNFKFEQAKAEFEFYPEKNMMILKQGGGKFELKRE